MLYEIWRLSYGNFFWQNRWIVKKYGNIKIEVDGVRCMIMQILKKKISK